MTADRKRPKVGDKILIVNKANDVTLIGTVEDLLSAQFTIRVTEPELFRHHIFFVLYTNDWLLQN